MGQQLPFSSIVCIRSVVKQPGCLTFFHRKVKAHFPPYTIETVW